MYLNSFRYVSDFADVNLWQWLKRDADAFDWSPYFSCVVEGKWEEGSEQQELYSLEGTITRLWCIVTSLKACLSRKAMARNMMF